MAALPNCHSVHLILTYLCIYTQTQIEFPLAPHFSCIKMRASPLHTHTFTHVAARHFSSYLWQESISKAYLELRPHRNGSNVPLMCFVPFCVTDSRIFPTSSTFAARRKRFKHQPLPWISKSRYSPCFWADSGLPCPGFQAAPRAPSLHGDCPRSSSSPRVCSSRRSSVRGRRQQQGGMRAAQACYTDVCVFGVFVPKCWCFYV